MIDTIDPVYIATAEAKRPRLCKETEATDEWLLPWVCLALFAPAAKVGYPPILWKNTVLLVQKVRI